MPGTKFFAAKLFYTRLRRSRDQIDALRQYFFRAPLVDRRPVITENFAENLVIIGAEPIGQPQRSFVHSSKQDPTAGNFKRSDQGVWERGEVVSVAQLHVLEEIGAGLNHARGTPGPMKLRHPLLGPPRLCPLLRDGIQFRRMLHPRRTLYETSIVNEFFLTDGATEA